MADTGPMAKKSATCSVCLSTKSLGEDGLMKQHTKHGVHCKGSGLPPNRRAPKPQRDRSRDRLPANDLRRAMLERDGYRCKKCRFHSPTGKGLEPNHIKSYLDGGLTELDNLDTLCASCHAELSWLWVNSPAIGYARWLEATPAIMLLRALLTVAGECEPPPGIPAEAIQIFYGITPTQARRLMFPDRAG